jgi:hypothetical protein
MYWIEVEGAWPHVFGSASFPATPRDKLETAFAYICPNSFGGDAFRRVSHIDRNWQCNGFDVLGHRPYHDHWRELANCDFAMGSWWCCLPRMLPVLADTSERNTLLISLRFYRSGCCSIPVTGGNLWEKEGQYFVKAIEGFGERHTCPRCFLVFENRVGCCCQYLLIHRPYITTYHGCYELCR